MSVDVFAEIGGFVVAVSTALVAWLQLQQTPSSSRDASRRRLTGANPTAPLRPPNGRLQIKIQGRDAILEQLRDAIRRPDGKVQVLTGMGGVGKSAIALKLAIEASKEGRQVWWIENSQQNDLASSLLGLSAHLGASSIEIQECISGIRNPSDVFWFRLNQRKGWVLILDNVDNLNALAPGGRSPGDGNGWLRSTRKGLVIVTSRNEDPALWGSISRIRKIGTLPKEDGGKLLLELAPSAGSYDLAQRVSAELGGLPLALTHAGRYLSTLSVAEQSFSAFLQELGNDMIGLLAGQSGVSQSRRVDICKTWDLSLELLVSYGIPEPRQTVLLLSLLSSPNPIPVLMFQAAVRKSVLPRTFLTSTLPALAVVGLSTFQTAGVRAVNSASGVQISLHPVVAEIFEKSATLSQILHSNRILLSCFESLVAELDREDPETWETWTYLVPHLVKMLESSLSQEEESASSLLHVTARVISSLAIASEHPKSEDLVERVRRYVSLFPSDSVVNVTARYCIAHAMRTRSHSQAGEGDFREILATQSTILGPAHPDSLHTRHNLAHTLAANGRIEESILEFTRTIEDRTRVLGSAHHLTISSRRALLFYLIRAGRLEQARDQHEAALILARQAFSSDHPAILSLRQRRAELDILEEALTGLEEELQDILRLQRMKLGSSHSCTIDTLISLGDLFEKRAQFGRAAESLVEALELLQIALGPCHSRVVSLDSRISSLRRLHQL